MKIYVVKYLMDHEEEVIIDSVWAKEENAVKQAALVEGWYIDMWIEDLP